MLKWLTYDTKPVDNLKVVNQILGNYIEIAYYYAACLSSQQWTSKILLRLASTQSGGSHIFNYFCVLCV